MFKTINFSLHYSNTKLAMGSSRSAINLTFREANIPAILKNGFQTITHNLSIWYMALKKVGKVMHIVTNLFFIVLQ